MANIDKISPGSFCWIELGTTDQNAAKSFYTSLFGWTSEDSPMGPGEFYTMFKLNGRNVAAGYTLRKGQQEVGVPPHWMLYVSVESADATAQKAKEAGAQLAVEPFDVFTFGRMAVMQDPTGAYLSIWQPKEHVGIQVTGEDGTLCWADLATPKVEDAKAFYHKVFGWEVAADEKDKSGYEHIKNGHEFIGGVPPSEHLPPGVPAHWLAYFLVSDCDQYANKARELGGNFCLEPMTIENVGRMAIIKDPQNAVFAIFQSMRKEA